MRRRTFLAAAAAVAIPGSLGSCSRSASPPSTRPWHPEHPLRIPPVVTPAAGKVRLRLQQGTHAFLPGRPTPSWGVNGSYLGPTVRLRRGDAVQVEVANALPETTTLHWHGLQVPGSVDGGPHQPITPGAVWRPTLPVEQPAATLWYHPHPHGRTALHVHRGIAGLLLVDDPGTTDDLPRRYGVDDIPLVLQDRTIDASGQSVMQEVPTFGQMGPDMCVNGTLQPWQRISTTHARLRILNGSNARVYHLALHDGRSFDVVGCDLGLLPSPVRTAGARLGPGERLEVVVPFAPGERVVLGTRGGDERVDEGDHPLVELRADPHLEDVPPPTLPLRGATPLVPPPSATVRRFRLQGHDEINGAAMDLGRIDEVVPRGALEVWEVENTVYAHNFHIHGVSVSILSRDGRPPEPWESGRKDTVHLPAGSTVRLAVQQGQHTDPRHPFMYHCHMLRHEDAGMMGQFVVVDPGTEASVPRRLEGSHMHH